MVQAIYQALLIRASLGSYFWIQPSRNDSQKQTVLQAQPLHGYADQSEFVQGPLSSPAALNSLSEHGVSMLHLVSGLGYDWACTALFNNGAHVHLQVCLFFCFLPFFKTYIYLHSAGLSFLPDVHPDTRAACMSM